MATDWTAAAGARIAAKFEDAAASGTINDSTSNNNDGTITNSTNVTQDVTGKYTKAIQFANGNNARANFGSAANLDNLANISVCVYLKNTSLGTASLVSDKAMIYSKGYRSGSLNFQTTNQLRWAEHYVGGTINYDTTDSDVVTGAFQHTAVTCGDRSGANPAPTVTFYLDGVAQTTSPSGTPFLARDDDSAVSVLIGSEENDSGELDSVMDELFVYSGILTSTDVNEIKDNGMDGVSGSTNVTKIVSALTIQSNLPSVLEMVTKLPSVLTIQSNQPSITERVTKTPNAFLITPTQPTPTLLNTSVHRTVSVSPLIITSSIIAPRPNVKIFPTAQSILSQLASPTKQVIKLASALSAVFNLPTITEKVTILPNSQIITAVVNSPTVDVGSPNRTVQASALILTSALGTPTKNVTKTDNGQVIQSNLPIVTVSQTADKTVSVDALTITSNLPSVSKECRKLPAGMTLASAMGGVTPKVSTDVSAFQLLASLPSVTISGGSLSTTYLADAFVIRSILATPNVAIFPKEFKRYAKHNQPKNSARHEVTKNISKHDQDKIVAKGGL